MCICQIIIIREWFAKIRLDWEFWFGFFLYSWLKFSTPLASLSKPKTIPIFLDIICTLVWFSSVFGNHNWYCWLIRLWKWNVLLIIDDINSSAIHVQLIFIFLWLFIRSMKPELYIVEACSIDSSLTLATNQFNAMFHVSCSTLDVQLAKWYIYNIYLV